MGGDDLDDYFVEEIKDSAIEKSAEIIDEPSPSKKRARAAVDDHQDDANSGDVDLDDKKKKKKTKNSLEAALISAGKHIEEKTAVDQMEFLSAAIKHYTLLTSNIVPDDVLSQEHFVSSNKENILDRIRDTMSTKAFKKHKRMRSPAVVIICQSARRAVAVLKECAPLKVRATKLFPKNGTVESQLDQLRSTSFGLAVGTPQRMEALCEKENGLTFAGTQLVVIDAHMSPKGFTVCTLPDTAVAIASLCREYILPEMKARKGSKNMRLAFF